MRDLVPRTAPHPWWWDGGLAVLGAGAAVLTVGWWHVALFTDGVPLPVGVRLAAALALCVPLVWRTHRPGVALLLATPVIVVDLVGGASPIGVLVLADLLYCAVLHGERQVSELTRRAAVVAWLAVSALFLATIGDLAAVLRSVLSAAALLVLPVMWAGEVRRPVEEAAAEREAAAQASRIAELDRHAAVADERARIARDLHDSVAGHLSAISLQSQAALRADGDDRATRDRVLTAVRENSVRALDEMRAMIEVLRTADDPAAALETGPAVGLAGLDGLVDSARATGLTVRADTRPTGDLPPAVDLTAYRILQEALTNASRHAQGASVEVVVERRGETLVLDVVNDRVPGTPRPGTGTGVDGMRVRAEAVGGSATAGPEPEPGARRWRVHAVLPLTPGARGGRGARETVDGMGR